MDGGVAIDERIKVTIEGGVADVRLVRTDKMNALDDAMFTALVAAVARLHGAEASLHDACPGLTVRIIFPVGD